MAKELRVEIRKDPPPNSGNCRSDPDPFKAKRGDFVTFDFDNEPDVRIIFSGESPFDASNKPFEPKRMEVRSDAPVKKDYRYRITWPGGGVGNGTGEIIP